MLVLWRGGAAGPAGFHPKVNFLSVWSFTCSSMVHIAFQLTSDVVKPESVACRLYSQLPLRDPGTDPGSTDQDRVKMCVKCVCQSASADLGK